jgi:hypothetical protein
MAADPIRLLVNGDVVTPAQEQRGGEPGHAGSNNGNAKTRS